MLTVLLSTATAALFGVADFLGGVASRRASAIAVTANAHMVGLAVYAVALLAFPVAFSSDAVAAGAAAGISGGIGVLCLYAALARGRMSVVAPITAALSGSLAALFDLIRGSSLSAASAIGLALAIAATAIVSASSGAGEEGEASALPPTALGLSVLSGVGFAGAFVSLSFAGDASGFWPLAAARAVSVAMLSVLALSRGGRPWVGADARRPTLAAGLLDAAANVTMLSAIRIGPLAVAAVIGSLYPVGTILLARFALGERLRPVQRFGVALALAAVVLAALS